MRVSVGTMALACALVMVGCGKSGGPPSAEEIRAESAKLPKQRPGLYVSSTRMLDFALQGAPPQDADRVRSQMMTLGQQRGSNCLTQAQSDGGFDELVRGLRAGSCKTESFAVEKGQLDAQLSCTNSKGVASRIGIKGTNTAETSHATVTIEQSIPDRKGVTMTMVMEADSYRKGDCS